MLPDNRIRSRNRERQLGWTEHHGERRPLHRLLECWKASEMNFIKPLIFISLSVNYNVSLQQGVHSIWPAEAFDLACTAQNVMHSACLLKNKKHALNG